MLHKRKKNSRMRASHTHGWGAKKKHRGTGHRGGKGHAGSGKRADSKVPLMRKLGWEMGKEGFIKKNKVVVYAFSIAWLNEKLNTLVNEKKVTKEKDAYVVDAASLGFQKLLATGAPAAKYMITVAKASESAVEKIESAGGKVTLTAPQEEEEEPAKKEEKTESE